MSAMTIIEFKQWLSGYEARCAHLTAPDYKKIIEKMKAELDGKPAHVDDVTKRPTFDKP